MENMAILRWIIWRCFPFVLSSFIASISLSSFTGQVVPGGISDDSPYIQPPPQLTILTPQGRQPDSRLELISLHSHIWIRYSVEGSNNPLNGTSSTVAGKFYYFSLLGPRRCLSIVVLKTT